MVAAPRPVFFPNIGLQVLCASIYFLGLTLLSHCLSRRLQHETLTYHGIATMPWPRLSVILMFVQAWLFLLCSGILNFGIGLEYSSDICTAAIYLCIIFYSSTKLFLYAFLVEKVHIVWSPTVGTRRFESPVYLVCIVSVSLYLIVTTLMVGGPIHEDDANGACVIGLKPVASIPLLAYDLYINMFLTFMFLYPLLRSRILNCGIRRLAIRTFIAAFVALTTSTGNIVVLILLNGRELGWISLGACGVDIIVNATAIFWVSSGRHSHQYTSSAERCRRPINPSLYSRDNTEIVHHAHKRSFVNYGDMSPDDIPSFPKYFCDELEASNPTAPRSKSRWFFPLFSRKPKPTEPRQIQILVTADFENSPIELHGCSDSHSEMEHVGLPRMPEKVHQ